MSRYHPPVVTMTETKWFEKWQDKLRSGKPFQLKDYLAMCVEMEAHETETHLKYAAVAEKEGKKEIAEMFRDLASGEDNFSDRLKELVEKWR